MLPGVFSPPLNGTYLLSLYGGGVSANPNYGGMVIRRNNEILCETWVGEVDGKIGKCMTIVELSVTDSVKVTGTSDNARIHGNKSGFSGHLIQANP